ncbi:MAG: sulfotransferase [Porticoccaceae bacterium]|nr:sulfotransferase [Porticoccaceae bacterium]
MLHLRQGEPQLASQLCDQGLTQHPNDANILCLNAQALIAVKNLQAAHANVTKALKTHPEFATAHEVYSDLLLLEGKFEQAISGYQHALKLAPDRSRINNKIERGQQLLQSLNANPQASREDMSFNEELAQAKQHHANEEPEKAEEIYRNILRKNPNHAEAMRLLASVATVHRKHEDAEILLLRAVSVSPKFARGWLDLAKTQLELGQYPEAVKSAESLVSLSPDIAESYVALANTQAQSNLTEQAIASYRHALEINRAHPGAFSGLAHQLKTVGRQQEAIDTHRQNIVINPTNSEPYWNLANLKTFRFEDSEVTKMEALLEDDSLEALSHVQLSNSLGLEYEGRKDYERAFSYFQRCNDLHRQSEKYDPIGHEVLIDMIQKIFSVEFLNEHQGLGLNDKSPILIVGLPRSGSTLIEQILASHSQVEGTHELSDLAQVVKDIKKGGPKGSHFPENLTKLPTQAWVNIGQQYIDRTLKYRSGSPRFIDKNPNNFIYAGLLKLVLPKAKIINARRHPLDSCFGSYKQLFASGQPFSYDLTELGEYYLQYQALMDHWHQVMPGAVLDVDYEMVVADLDTQVRRILDYCELPFEESCLRFHETDRAVRTASSEQVRQPIYASSVNLWKNYEPYIEELIEVLEPLLLERDS